MTQRLGGRVGEWAAGGVWWVGNPWWVTTLPGTATVVSLRHDGGDGGGGGGGGAAAAAVVPYLGTIVRLLERGRAPRSRSRYANWFAVQQVDRQWWR